MSWGHHLQGCLRIFWRCERGQSTVEAALTIPVLFGLILVLVQPAIVLYDALVMRDAAAEGCRVLITSAGDQDETLAFVRRRLGSVPQQNLFHVHDVQSCSWVVTCTGSESADEVRITIQNDIEPLPLIGYGASFLDLLNDQGYFTFEVSVGMPVQPGWIAQTSAGSSPEAWVGAWLDD